MQRHVPGVLTALQQLALVIEPGVEFDCDCAVPGQMPVPGEGAILKMRK